MSIPVPRWAPRPSPAFPAPAIEWAADEPFISLPGGLTLTPFRDTPDEAAALVEISNLATVGRWSYGRPYPYAASDARARLDAIVPAQREAIATLRASGIPATLPFTVIRDTGYAGEVSAWTDAQRPDVWQLSFSVHPRLHRRGVASAAIKAAVGFLASVGATKFEAMVEVANGPSTALMTHLGFVAAQQERIPWPTGGEREVLFFQREFGAPRPLPPAPPLPVPEVHWDNGEPYLVPLPGFILTPYRDPEDVQGLMEVCNTPEVGRWAHARPYPFKEIHARERLDKNIPQRASVAALRADPGAVVAMSPFTVVREVATGRYVGDIVARPVADVGEGTPATWVAYVLHPDFHGRGIGTAVIAALLGWVKGGIGASRMHAAAQTDNPASNALLAKLGFTRVSTALVQWPEDKGGDWREVADWQRDL